MSPSFSASSLTVDDHSDFDGTSLSFLETFSNPFPSTSSEQLVSGFGREFLKDNSTSNGTLTLTFPGACKKLSTYYYYKNTQGQTRFQF